MSKRRISKMKSTKLSNAISVIAIMVLSMIIFSNIAYAIPYGPTEIKNLSTTTKNTTGPKSRGFDQRGTITTIRLTVSQQTSKWKAYVGNISGKITLDDAQNYTIYDWGITTAQGEVYATRKTTTVTWASITCASISQVESEQSALKHNVLVPDCLNRTFTDVAHPAFYAGPTSFAGNVCNKSANLYQNDAANTHTWHEVLLQDGTNIVYAAILNETQQGYNPNKYHDFQMIVAENGSEGSPTVTTYYFYVELT
jgi:hypothetical protein